MNTQPLKRIVGALVLVGVAGLALAGCSSASGATPGQAAPSSSAPAKPSKGRQLPAGESRVAGTLSSVSGSQLVVTKRDGSTETLTTDSSTKINTGPLSQGQRIIAVVKGQQAVTVRVVRPRGSAAPTTTPSS